MANAENRQKVPTFTPEDFLGPWRTLSNGKGLSEEAIKQAVGKAGVNTDIIGRVDEAGVLVLGKAKDFVKGLVSPTHGNI